MWEARRGLSPGLEIPDLGNSCEERAKEARAGGGGFPGLMEGCRLTALLPPSRGGLEAVKWPESPRWPLERGQRLSHVLLLMPFKDASSLEAAGLGWVSGSKGTFN